MSWNPEQKGLDDALLAVSRGEITLSDMGLSFGTPEKLFPKDQAAAPNPYRLDGTRANRLAWQIEDDQNRKEMNKKIAALQAETKRRAKEAKKEKAGKKEAGKALDEGLKGLGENGQQM